METSPLVIGSSPIGGATQSSLEFGLLTFPEENAQVARKTVKVVH